MTNYEKWCCYTEKLTSPQSFLDFGYYFMISAALQRRVWYYDSKPLFCNQYIVFVGPPGCGKGLVLGEVADFLRYHKYEKGESVRTNIGYEKPLLFPLGADSITFEELLADVARSIRRVPVLSPSGESLPPYAHTSYAFCLEELSSLFKRKTEDVIKFLQNAYDCKNYDYKTKHQGKDLLRNLCVAFIAGTQVDFLKECRSSRLFGQGFASRALWLFESKERFTAFHISGLTQEQQQCRSELLEWLKRLATLYGPIDYEESTASFLEEWWHAESNRLTKMPFHMQDYAGRKKVIMLKLAGAMHFSENLHSTVSTATMQRAIDTLAAIEPQMEAGLGLSGRNELHFFTRKLLSWIRTKGTVLFAEIVVEFGSSMSIQEIESAIRELELGYNLKTKLVNHQKAYYL